MSPRNFEKVSKLPKPIYDDRVLHAPNFWYAFTAVTGIDKLFSYTASMVPNNPVKDGEARVDQTTPNIKSL